MWIKTFFLHNIRNRIIKGCEVSRDMNKNIKGYWKSITESLKKPRIKVVPQLAAQGKFPPRGTYIFRRHSRDFDDCSSPKWLPKCIPRVFSRIYLRNRVAYRGYKYSIRGSNLGGSRESETDRLSPCVSPSILPWIRRAKRRLYTVPTDANAPNMRVLVGWLAPHGPIYIGVTRNKRDIIHGDTARARLRLALTRACNEMNYILLV